MWVDATLFCNAPLDTWLPELMGSGFFAFADPASDRPVSSWFLSAEPGNGIVARWYSALVLYWRDRARADDYFWLHGLFRSLLAGDAAFADLWSRVPYRSAGPPHALQTNGRMAAPFDAVADSVDWSVPVFKLTHRLPPEALGPATLLGHLLGSEPGERAGSRGEGATSDPATSQSSATSPAVHRFASLQVSTENLGDHIQIVASLDLLARLGVAPELFIDRDHAIMSAPALEEAAGPVGIVLNGWFKANRAEWPPHPQLLPLICGFHIRLFQCPELMGPASLAYFRRHQPIGCRDVYTQQLLQAEGIDAFVSNCLSLTLPRRIGNPADQTEIFVVSRDDRIAALLPASLGPSTFICHYSGSFDFEANMARATELLARYAARAKLIVTTLLHCALPAIAMGIPVVVFYPLNDAAGHASDRERFSSLSGMIDIHDLDAVAAIDWSPPPVDASTAKLAVLDAFFAMAERWQLPRPPPIGPIAPARFLPPP